MIAADIVERLRARFPAIGQLPAPAIESIAREAEIRRASAGTVMFSPEQACSGFPLLLEGSVRVVKTAPNGREIQLYRVEPGDSCVLSGGCLMGDIAYSATGIAVEDVTVVVLPAALFQNLLVSHEPFRRYVFGLYGERLAEVMELVEEVAFRKLDARLAQLLIHRGPVVRASHQRIADDLGSVREIVSRLLKSFEDRGLVELARGEVRLVDPRALAAIARGEG